MALLMPGQPARSASFDEPLEMIEACHERVEASLRRLLRLLAHLEGAGALAAASDAAKDVLRYFDLAAPLHHADEEAQLFPALAHALGASMDAALRDAIARLIAEHAQLVSLWHSLRPGLQQIAEGPAPDATQLAALQRDAREFAALYRAHLELEEAVVLPAARRHLGDASALGELGAAMARRRGLRP